MVLEVKDVMEVQYREEQAVMEFVFLLDREHTAVAEPAVQTVEHSDIIKEGMVVDIRLIIVQLVPQE